MEEKKIYDYGKQSGYSQGKAEATREQILQNAKEQSWLTEIYTKKIERLENKIKQYDLQQDTLEQQLQAYKDREDKLRDTLLTEIRWQNGIGEVLVEKKLRELLQILNKEER